MWKFFTEETQVAMAAHYEDKLKRALYKGFSISKDKEQVWKEDEGKSLMGPERNNFFFSLSALGPIIHLFKKMMEDAQTQNLRLII